MKRARRPSTVRSFLINCALFCAVLLVMLLFFEVVLRFFPGDVPTTKYDPYYVYRFNPGVSQTTFAPDLNETLTKSYNELGWLGPMSEYAVNRTKPVRILVIGDSFTSQLNLESYNDLFTKQLEAMYSDVQVTTIGVGGYAFDNEAKVMEIEGARYNPDIVIFATFINDVTDSYRDNVFSVRNGTLVDNTPRDIPLARKLIFQCWTHSRVCGLLADTLAQQGELINKLTTFLGISDIKRDYQLHYRLWGLPDDLFINATNATQPESITSSWQKTDLLLKRDKAIADERGYKLYYVLIPVREQVSETSREVFFAQNPDLNVSTFDVSKPYNDIKNLLLQNNLTIIDLAPGFTAASATDDLYYTIDPHWNKKGHALAAHLIADALNISVEPLN